MRGINDGDEVTLASRVGETTLHAVLSDRMPAGVVYTTFHHPVSGANVVTTENSDWATNCPEYKVTAVQVALRTSRPATRREQSRGPVRTAGRADDEYDGYTAGDPARHRDRRAVPPRPPEEAAQRRSPVTSGSFWDPRMRTQLKNQVAQAGQDCDSVVAAAGRADRR